jgi:Mg/Co/Ni transporter MgtE
MRLPYMDPDPTCLDRPSPVDTVEITPATPSRVAAEVLLERHLAALVVTDHDVPLGVVTRHALTTARPGSHVAEVMDYEVVCLDRCAGERRTLGAFREAAWRSLHRRHPCALGD